MFHVLTFHSSPTSPSNPRPEPCSMGPPNPTPSRFDYPQSAHLAYNPTMSSPHAGGRTTTMWTTPRRAKGHEADLEVLRPPRGRRAPHLGPHPRAPPATPPTP